MQKIISLILVISVLIMPVSAKWVDSPTPSEWEPSLTDCEFIAQTLYGECRYLSKLEQSAVAWVILNRVDSELPYFPDTVEEVVKQKLGNQKMFAYDPKAPVTEELLQLALDVVTRWGKEHMGKDNVGRTLPIEYLYFWGDGKKNYFRTDYTSYNYWDWSWANPYGEEQP